MPIRPKHPQPIKRWPFIAGDIAFLAIALITLLSAGSPPALGSIVLAFACVLLGIGLLVTPYLMDYEARVRFAEASAREQVDTQSRRVGETAENLANAVSRSQTIEEQASQALGTLEEMAERLSVQAEDLSQRLAQSSADQLELLKVEIQDITRERDEKLAALGKDIARLSGLVGESRTAADRAEAARADRLDEIADQLAKITARLEHPGPDTALPVSRREPAGGAGEPADPEPKERPTPEPAPTADSEAKANAEPDDPPPPTAVEEPAPKNEGPKTRPPTKARKTPRPKSTRSASPASPGKKTPDSHSLELALDGEKELKKPARRDAGTSTSLVATAYIGIGNKLYLRGEGPGLSWDQGVPMQFLAIGKWGWSTAETGADEQIVCRIYRNDDTPMLDEDIIVPAGSKTEVTPRF